MTDPAVLVFVAASSLITTACHELRAYAARQAERRAECERIGHDFAEPFGSGFGQHRNCRRCKLQQHERSDGSWQ